MTSAKARSRATGTGSAASSARSGAHEPRWVRVWLRSNRGTDAHDFFEVGQEDLDDKGVMKDLVESWCQKFAAWTQSECSYGWDRVKAPPVTWLQKKIEEFEDRARSARAAVKRWRRLVGEMESG